MIYSFADAVGLWMDTGAVRQYGLIMEKHMQRVRVMLGGNTPINLCLSAESTQFISMSLNCKTLRNVDDSFDPQMDLMKGSRIFF